MKIAAAVALGLASCGMRCAAFDQPQMVTNDQHANVDQQ